METQTFDLKQYIKAPQEASLEELQRLDSQLEELANSRFEVERLPQKLLLKQKAVCTYPKISPEFLKMHNEKEWKRSFDWKGTISIPKFGVYTLDNPYMKIIFGKDTPCGYYAFVVEEPKGLPEVLKKQLAMSTEIFRSGKIPRITEEGAYCSSGWVDGLAKEVRKKFRKVGAVTILSTFNGILPTETRKRIIEAKKIFSNNIFLIAETKPEEWTIKKYQLRLVTDPISIGIIDNDCFYIDKFDTTSLEDYISKEFTG